MNSLSCSRKRKKKKEKKQGLETRRLEPTIAADGADGAADAAAAAVNAAAAAVNAADDAVAAAVAAVAASDAAIAAAGAEAAAGVVNIHKTQIKEKKYVLMPQTTQTRRLDPFSSSPPSLIHPAPFRKKKFLNRLVSINKTRKIEKITYERPKHVVWARYCRHHLP